MAAKPTESELTERRRAAEARIKATGETLAGLLGVRWQAPKHQWHLDVYHVQVLEAAADLIDSVASTLGTR